MNIEKIILYNFKCFKGKFELKLKDGTNIIVGNNEAGKSTIIEAIHLALTGLFKGRYLRTELTQYLFNKEVIDSYIEDVKNNRPVKEMPFIFIEIYLKTEILPLYKGSRNSEKSNSTGVQLRIEFDENYLEEYNTLVQSGDIHSLPIEYYRFRWFSFAEEQITPRIFPFKSALIDSSSSRLQNGSDLYISRIVKDYLDSKEVVEVSQAHRKMKDAFMQEGSIQAINKKIQGTSMISNKKVELSVELSSKNAWENSVVTYLDDIPFHHIGKGEQCIIKTKLALSNKRAQNASVILIEEPENHLSHSKLNQLIKNLTLNEIQNDEDGGVAVQKQIIITTHNSFVANKLGLDNLILLNDGKTIVLYDVTPETKLYFEKLAGYDTLRLILCRKAILVEGDSDELIIQKIYAERNNGKLPIEDEIDVISVGTSFLRFLEIAKKLNLSIIVVTDNDGDIGALERKYSDYLGAFEKMNIKILYDAEIDTGIDFGGKTFNYNTLEPKIVKANGNCLDTMNEVLGTNYDSLTDLHKYMNTNKTNCALKIFNSDSLLQYPEYLLSAVEKSLENGTE